MKAISKFFKFEEKGTNFSTELRAGFTTFLAMMYIVPVNAMILSQAGLPYNALITATALVTLIASVLNGLWSNTPIAMSVGMGLNAYFTFGLVKGMGIDWRVGLGIVFLSGFIFLLLSLTKFRIWILESVPVDLRRAISAGIGVFIAFIGLKGMGVIVSNPETFVSLGDLSKNTVLLGIAGFLLAAVLYVWRVKGAFIISIFSISAISWILGITPLPEGFVSKPSSISEIAFKADIFGAMKLSLLPVIIVFLITDMFDSVGTLAGVGLRANLFKEGSKELQRTLEADAAATTIGALLGTSTTTSFIESAAGVEEGGRTGLTAVFTGLFFILTIFLLPVFKAIPDFAVNPVLVMVGVLMFGELGKINFSDYATAVSAFITVILMPLTYSITYGLSAGFIVYLLLKLIKGETKDINAGTIALALIGLAAFVFS